MTIVRFGTVVLHAGQDMPECVTTAFVFASGDSVVVAAIDSPKERKVKNF